MRYLAPLLALLAIAVLVSVIEGTPDPLPAVALGSGVLLHVLRAAAMFAVVFIVATVLARARSGSLPTELSTSGIGYAAEETSAVLAELQAQVDEQQATLDHLATRIDTSSETA